MSMSVPHHEEESRAKPSFGRLPQMGVRFVMIELCRTVLTRCNLEEGRSDVEEWDLEERDLTKLVERSVSREDTSVIEVSSVVCCRTIWLTTDLSWKWKRYISSSKSYRAARRCAGFNAHFDHVKIARRRLFFGFIREGDTPSTASPSRMHHRWLALSCRCQELFSPTLPPWVSCRSKLQQGKFSFGLHWFVSLKTPHRLGSLGSYLCGYDRCELGGMLIEPPLRGL